VGPRRRFWDESGYCLTLSKGGDASEGHVGGRDQKGAKDGSSTGQGAILKLTWGGA